MGIYEDVTSSLAQLRRGDGLTPEALEDQHVLLRMLNADDQEDGARRLAALIDELGDGHQAVALRHALAVGVPRRKNVTARRKAAIEDGHFYGSERAQFYAENQAIEQLARLIVTQAQPELPDDVEPLAPHVPPRNWEPPHRTTFWESVRSSLRQPRKPEIKTFYWTLSPTVAGERAWNKYIHLGAEEAFAARDKAMIWAAHLQAFAWFAPLYLLLVFIAVVAATPRVR
ncbi:hypothetical protein [Streptomyces sp. cg40]|uniref:hypothetical protein n=1 Tax=Streptomyces sp. cg40 TaxID=3419764 RepID=UPI003CFC161B